MGFLTNILDATEKSIGRNPSPTWIDLPAEMLYPPGTGTDAVNIGVSVADAVSAYILASPRAVVGYKSAHLTITRSSFLSSYTYTVDLDGNTYASTGEADAVAAVADLVSQINTAAVGTVRAAAVASTTDGILDTVWAYEPDVNGGAAANLVVDFTSDGPAGTAVGYVDPESFSVRVWVQLASPAQLPQSIPWAVPLNGDLGAVPAQGVVERLNVAGFQRMYAEAYDVVKTAGDGANVTARPTLFLAPAIGED